MKPEFPPLYPFGFHLKTESELRTDLVDGFPLSKRRAWLWSNFELILAEIKSSGLKCRIWLDGSYVTEKIDPDDIDIIVEVSITRLENPTPEQALLLDNFSENVYHTDEMKLHTFVIFDAPHGHLARAAAERLQTRWINDWGYSLVKREPKGIALLEVSP